MPSALPSGPWQKIGVDLLYHQQTRRNYIVAVDYFSRWIECVYLESTTSSSCINKLKDIFSRHGIPYQVISDNGPQFSSQEFKDFSQKYDFAHITSSPYMANSNGEAERAVQTSKKILNQDDPWMAMMTYRDTVIQATGKSPAQLMFGRHIRTNLPTLPSALENKDINMDIVRERDGRYKSKYTEYYDSRHGVKSLPAIRPGDQVRLRTTEKHWNESGRVVKKASTPRSYIIETNGKEVRRNRRHLRVHDKLAQSNNGHIPTPNIVQSPSPGHFLRPGPSHAYTSHLPNNTLTQPKTVSESLTGRATVEENILPTEEPPVIRSSGRSTARPRRLIEEI